MGMLYSISQKIPFMRFWFAPDDYFELVDRIGKLQERGIGLAALLLTPMESCGCAMWESKVNRNDPVSALWLQYNAKFSNEKQHTVLEKFAYIEDGKLMKGCGYLRHPSGFSPEEWGRAELQKYMLRQAEWLRGKGFSVTLK